MKRFIKNLSEQKNELYEFIIKQGLKASKSYLENDSYMRVVLDPSKNSEFKLKENCPPEISKYLGYYNKG